MHEFQRGDHVLHLGVEALELDRERVQSPELLAQRRRDGRADGSPLRSSWAMAGADAVRVLGGR